MRSAIYGITLVLSASCAHAASHDPYALEMLRARYQRACVFPSSINEHVATLAKYAQDSSSVVEIGVQSISTWGLLLD